MREVRCDAEKTVRLSGAPSSPVLEVVVESAEERSARLRTLRSAIASGVYRVPPEIVADKVLQRMRSEATPVIAGGAPRTVVEPSPGKARVTDDKAPRRDAEQTGL